MNERVVWRGKPSQLKNFRIYAFCAMIFLIVLLALIWLWGWLQQPSRIWHIRGFILGELVLLLFLPVLIALWKWLEVRNETYEVTSRRIRSTCGVLTKRSDDLELYRVKDIVLVQPFLLRLFSLGTLVLKTHDSSTPLLVMTAIPRPEWLRDEIRSYVGEDRSEKNVRVTEFEQG